MNNGYILEYNGYTFGDGDYYVYQVLDGISGRPIRVSQNNLVGADGGNIWARKRGMRDLSIRGVVGTLSDNFSDYYDVYRRDLMLAFNIEATSNDLYITRPDGVRRYINAKVVQEPVIEETVGEREEAEFTLQLRSETGLIEDDTLSIASLSFAAPGGTPVSSPVPSPVGGGNAVLIISNTGDGLINPVYRVTGPATNVSITNQSTGEFLVVNTVIPSGSFLEAFIDNQGESITLNGTTNLNLSATGDIPILRKGTNAIAINASSFGAGAGLTVSYRQNYLTL